MVWGYHFTYFRCSGWGLGAEGFTGLRVKVFKRSGVSGLRGLRFGDWGRLRVPCVCGGVPRESLCNPHLEALSGFLNPARTPKVCKIMA